MDAFSGLHARVERKEQKDQGENCLLFHDSVSKMNSETMLGLALMGELADNEI
jgi:hypothetical protein